MRNIFAERVERRLGELDINQTDLAKRLNITPQTVTQTLTRNVRHQQATVERWAKALETSPDFLLGLDAPQPKVDEAPLLREAMQLLSDASPTQLRSVIKILKVSVSPAAVKSDKTGTGSAG